MPTQEEINQANVELWIANDKYADLANKYSKYLNIFSRYENASPELQQKASGVIQKAMDEFEQLKLDMYATENRINIAQNRVNSLNEQVAKASAQTSMSSGGQRRRISGPTPETVVVEETAVPAEGKSNPYMDLYSLYAARITNGQDLGSYYDNLHLTASQMANGMLGAGLTQDQVNDFLIGWRDHLQNKVNAAKGGATIVTAEGGTPTITTSNGGAPELIIPEINVVTPQQTTRRKVINPINDAITTIKSIPNKVNGTIEMLQATPSLLGTANNTLEAYNRATTWNGLRGLGDNIQGGIDTLSSLPKTLFATNRFLGGLNTYRGN